MKNNLIFLHNNYIGVVVPKDAEEIQIASLYGSFCVIFKSKDIGVVELSYVFKRPEIIGTYPEISEEQAKEMIHERPGRHGNYLDYLWSKRGGMAICQVGVEYNFKTALESLQSLFESKGVDMKESKIVIIKTEK
jgi:hypothetical protein